MIGLIEQCVLVQGISSAFTNLIGINATRCEVFWVSNPIIDKGQHDDAFEAINHIPLNQSATLNISL